MPHEIKAYVDGRLVAQGDPQTVNAELAAEFNVTPETFAAVAGSSEDASAIFGHEIRIES